MKWWFTIMVPAEALSHLDVEWSDPHWVIRKSLQHKPLVSSAEKYFGRENTSANGDGLTNLHVPSTSDGGPTNLHAL